MLMLSRNTRPKRMRILTGAFTAPETCSVGAIVVYTKERNSFVTDTNQYNIV